MFMVKNTRLLNDHYFEGAHWNCLYEAITMCTNNIETEIKETYFGNIHLSRIMSISFATLKHLNLPIIAFLKQLICQSVPKYLVLYGKLFIFT